MTVKYVSSPLHNWLQLIEQSDNDSCWWVADHLQQYCFCRVWGKQLTVKEHVCEGSFQNWSWNGHEINVFYLFWLAWWNVSLFGFDYTIPQEESLWTIPSSWFSHTTFSQNISQVNHLLFLRSLLFSAKAIVNQNFINLNSWWNNHLWNAQCPIFPIGPKISYSQPL